MLVLLALQFENPTVALSVLTGSRRSHAHRRPDVPSVAWPEVMMLTSYFRTEGSLNWKVAALAAAFVVLTAAPNLAAQTVKVERLR